MERVMFLPPNFRRRRHDRPSADQCAPYGGGRT